MAETGASPPNGALQPSTIPPPPHFLIGHHVEDHPVLEFIDGILMETQDEFDDALSASQLLNHLDSPASFHDPTRIHVLEGDHINFLYNNIFNDFYQVLASDSPAAAHMCVSSSSNSTTGSAGFSCSDSSCEYPHLEHCSSAEADHIGGRELESGTASVSIRGFASAYGHGDRIASDYRIDSADCNFHGSSLHITSSATSAARYPWQRRPAGSDGSHYDATAAETSTGSRDSDIVKVGIPAADREIGAMMKVKPILIDSTSQHIVAAAAAEISEQDCDLWRTPIRSSQFRWRSESFSNTTAESQDFSFNDEVLELEAEYESLYVDRKPERVDATGGGVDSGKRRKAAAIKRKGGAAPGYYDVEELLLNCAQAVARWEVKKARDLVNEAKKMASQGRSSLHRMALHFCHALEARLDGTGAALYAASARFGAFPSGDTVRALRRLFTTMHSIKLSHFVANETIAAAARGRRRLHIVDYGIGFGLQWPHLIKALSQREGGPPNVVITGVEQPHRARSPNGRGAAELVEQTGRRLAEYARVCGVPFEFHAVTSRDWEELDGGELKVRGGTGDTEGVLVVNAMKRLETVPDESSAGEKPIQMRSGRRKSDETANGNGDGGGGGASARQRLLCRMRELMPEVTVIGVSNGSYNAPTFMTRFKETLQYYTGVYEMLEATGVFDCPERLLLEKRMIEPAIVNMVACEGSDRVERPESYRQWQGRLQRAGFKQLPLPPPLITRASAYVGRHYHPDSTVLQDDAWLLFGWRGRVSLAVSVWSAAGDP